MSKQNFPSEQAQTIETALREAGAVLMADDKIERSGGVNLLSVWGLRRNTNRVDVCMLQDHGDNMGATVYWAETDNSLEKTLARIRGDEDDGS